MQVIFDLQDEIDCLDLKTSRHIVPTGANKPRLSISEIDGIKIIRVRGRLDPSDGIGITLQSLQVKTGDRVVITGHVGRDVPMGSWGIALSTEETCSRSGEECQLAQSTSPKSLFSLSYVICEEDLDTTISVQTTRWGAINPIMDFYIDGILIMRDKQVTKVKEDPRGLVYSLEQDDKVVVGGEIASEGQDSYEHVSNYLALSGEPDVKIFLHNDITKALYISRRKRDYDGIDIRLNRMSLLPGNSYRITVNGSIDGHAPEGTIVTLQGLPGYSWRNNQLVSNNDSFTLCYSLSQADLQQWNTIRITTNTIGATVSFYVYSVEIKRLGLL